MASPERAGLGRRELLKGMLATGMLAAVSGAARADTGRVLDPRTKKDRLELDDPVAFIDEFQSSLNNLIELDSDRLIERVQKYSPFKIKEISRKLHNTVSGERVRFLYGENGEFATLYEVESQGFIPFEHAHADEEEDFHLLEGEFTLYLNGEIVEAKAGETVKVPKNTWHRGFNHGNEPARFFVNFKDGKSEYAGKETFQAYWILCDLGYVDEDGKPNPGKMLRLTAESTSVTRIKGIPGILQDTADFFVDKATRNVLSRPKS